MAAATPLTDPAASPCFRHASADVVDWYAADTPLVHATLARVALLHLLAFPINAVAVPAALGALVGFGGLWLLGSVGWLVLAQATLTWASLRVPLRHLRITRHGLTVDARFTPWPATRMALADHPDGVPPPPLLLAPEGFEIPFEDVDMVCFEGPLLRILLRHQPEIQVTLDPMPADAVRELLDDIQRARDVHLAHTANDAGEAAARWELEALIERA